MTARERFLQPCRLVAAVLSLWIAGQSPVLSQQLNFVVPYAAGGPTDVIARLLGERMARSLGQSVIVENIAGSGGTMAPTRVARAAPDGTTILIHHNTLAAAPALYSNLSYDTKTAFEPIGLVNSGPMVLVGRKTLEAKTPQELFAWIKATGDKVNFAHAGAGTSQHLCTTLLGNVLGVKPTFVSYRGAAPAMNDLIGGQIDLICDQATTAVPQVQSDLVRAFAVTSRARIESIATVPTTAEIGVPEVDYTVWHGLYVPKGTPRATIDKLNAALRHALEDPAVVERFKQLGTTAFPPSERSPQVHVAWFAREIDRLGRLVETAGMKAAEVK